MRNGEEHTTALIARAAPTPLVDGRTPDRRPPPGRVLLLSSLLAGLAAAGVLAADGLVTEGRASVIRVVAGTILVAVSAGALPPSLRPVARAVGGVAFGAVAGLLAVLGGRSVDVSASSARLVLLWAVALIVAARPHAVVRVRPPLLVVALVSAASTVLLAGALVTGAWTAIALIAAAAMPVATVLYLLPAATDTATMLDDAALLAAVAGLAAVWLDDVQMTDALPFTLAVVAAAGAGALSIVGSERMLRSVVAAATAGALLVILAAPPSSTLAAVVIAAGVVWTTRRSAVGPEPVAVTPPVPTVDRFEAARRVAAVRSLAAADRTPDRPRVLGPVRHDAVDARPVTVVPEFVIDSEILHDTAPHDARLADPNLADLILADVIHTDPSPVETRPVDLVPDLVPVDLVPDPVDPVPDEAPRAAEPGTVDLIVAHYFDGLMGNGSSVTEPDEAPPLDRLGAALDQIERGGRTTREPHPRETD